jgi:hypothetical protein
MSTSVTIRINNACWEKYAGSHQTTAGTVSRAEEYAQMFGLRTLTRG